MAIAEETTMRIVLYEGEGAVRLSAQERGAALLALLEKGYAATGAEDREVSPAEERSLLMLGQVNKCQASEG